MADDWRQRLVVLLEHGEQIEAIKLYREQTGVGLAEAKYFIEELARSLATGDWPPGASEPAPGGDEDQFSGGDRDVLELLRQEQKIAAIKLYRERHRVGLKEAKEAVESLAAQAGIAPAKSGCAGIVLCGLLVAYGVSRLMA